MSLRLERMHPVYLTRQQLEFLADTCAANQSNYEGEMWTLVSYLASGLYEAACRAQVTEDADTQVRYMVLNQTDNTYHVYTEE